MTSEPGSSLKFVPHKILAQRKFFFETQKVKVVTRHQFWPNSNCGVKQDFCILCTFNDN